MIHKSGPEVTKEVGLFSGVAVMTALQHVQQGCVSDILKLVQTVKSNQSLVLMGMLLPGAEWLSLLFFQSWQVYSEGCGIWKVPGSAVGRQLCNQVWYAAVVQVWPDSSCVAWRQE